MLAIFIHNDGTGTSEIGNYDIEVFVNQTLIDNIRVEGHVRSEGWRTLVRKMLIESGPPEYLRPRFPKGSW